jgi:hypothetical protein
MRVDGEDENEDENGEMRRPKCVWMKSEVCWTKKLRMVMEWERWREGVKNRYDLGK